MRAKRNKFICCLLVLFILGSCQNKKPNTYTPEEISGDPLGFIKEITKNDELKNNKIIGPVKYTIAQSPLDLEALKRINPTEWSKDSLNRYLEDFRQDYAHIIFLNYKITFNDLESNVLRESKSSFSSYQDLVYYCSFYMSKDVFLIIDSDTLPCHSLGFEQTYEIGKEMNFSICFKKKDINASAFQLRNATVVIDDKLFKNGTLKFKFS